jgi:hypothetical protein
VTVSKLSQRQAGFRTRRLSQISATCGLGCP